MRGSVLLLVCGIPLIAWIADASSPVATVSHGLTVFDGASRKFVFDGVSGKFVTTGKALYLFPSIYNGKPVFDHKGCIKACHTTVKKSKFARRGRRRRWRRPKVVNHDFAGCLTRCKTKAVKCLQSRCRGLYKASYDVKQCDWWKQCYDKICHCNEADINRGPRCRSLITTTTRKKPSLLKQKRKSKYVGQRRRANSILSMLMADNPPRRTRRNRLGRAHSGRGTPGRGIGRREMHYRARSRLRYM